MWQPALADFNKALEITPKFDYAYYNRGIAYKDKGDLDQAILVRAAMRTITTIPACLERSNMAMEPDAKRRRGSSLRR